MALAQVGAPNATGVRLFNPFRDLPAVASLLVRVFGDEMRLESVADARMIDLAMRIPSLAWVWMGFDAWFDGSLTGFVWHDGGRIVGNATVAPVADSAQRWVLSNVAVEPAYRRRGAGAALVAAAVEYATLNGATSVLLQVWASNGGAVRLYERQGFRVLAETRRLRWRPDAAATGAGGALPAGYTWRQTQGSDRYGLVTVANAMTQYELQRLRSTGVRAFSGSAGDGPRALAVALGLARPAPRRVLWRGDRIVGGVAISDGARRLVALLRPEEQPELAASVAAESARLALAHAGSELICDVPARMDTLCDSLVGAGFAAGDGLLHMVLNLKATA